MEKKENSDIYRENNAVTLLEYRENSRHNLTRQLYLMKRYRIPRQENLQAL